MNRRDDSLQSLEKPHVTKARRDSEHLEETTRLPDLNAGNRYYLAADKLLCRGVVQRSDREPFRPDAPITVAEFAGMVVPRPSLGPGFARESRGRRGCSAASPSAGSGRGRRRRSP